MSELPKWPEVPERVPGIESFNHDTPFSAMAWHDYEHARAEAALARLRVAYVALNQLAVGLPSGPGEEDGFTYDEAAEVAIKALRAIGPLP